MILRPNHMLVLQCLDEHFELCMTFKGIQNHVALDRAEIRRCCRYLRKRGLAEYHNALWTDDGEPAGAGYCITPKGIEELKRRMANDQGKPRSIREDTGQDLEA